MAVGKLAGADRALIPEAPFDPEKLADLLLGDKASTPFNYAILAMSEAAVIEPEKVSHYLPEISRSANSRSLGEAIATRGEGTPSSHFVFELVQELSSRVGGSGTIVTEILENITGQRMLFQPASPRSDRRSFIGARVHVLRLGIPAPSEGVQQVYVLRPE